MSKNVLFLCTGNSCGSQIAEAIVNHRLTNLWQANSASSKPSNCAQPYAIKVLNKIGIQQR